MTSSAYLKTQTNQSPYQRIIEDTGGGFVMVLLAVGCRLEFFDALKDSPLTTTEFSRITGVNIKYAEEWLKCMSFSGYIQVQPRTRKYFLSEEQKDIYLNRTSSNYWIGMISMWEELSRRIETISEIYRLKNHSQHEIDSASFPHYISQFSDSSIGTPFISRWLYKIGGLMAKLNNGCSAADIGCGTGSIAMKLATEFPNARITGVDLIQSNVEFANKQATEQGLTDRVEFIQQNATTFLGEAFDLVLLMDVLSATADPAMLLGSCLALLDQDGLCVVVAPKNETEINSLSTGIGKILYGFSCLHELPISINNEVPVGTLAWSLEALTNVCATHGSYRVDQVGVNSDFYNLFVIRRMCGGS